MVAHRLVEVQAGEQRRVEAGQQLVGDDQDARLAVRALEVEQDLRLARRRDLILRHQRAFPCVVVAPGVDRRGPLRRQQRVELLLVAGACLTVHGYQEYLVAERRDPLPVVPGHECGHLAHAVAGGQEGTQMHGAVEHAVELLHVGHPLGAGGAQELAVELLGRNGEFARRQRVPDRQGGLVLDRVGDRVLVQIAVRVVGAEDLEGALAVGGAGDRRAGKADDGGGGEGGHQVAAEVAGDRAVRLVDEHVDAAARVGVPVEVLKLVDQRQDQAALVGGEQLAQRLPGVRAPHRYLLLLHLAEQPLHPLLELAFELGAVHHHDHGRVAEPLGALQDQPRGGEQGKGLARPLRVPDQAAPLGRLGAPFDDALHGAALVLAQHRLARFAVLHVEQNPVAQGAQEAGRLEERLHREAVVVAGPLLPARQVTARGVPGDPVPVVEDVGDVEELRRGQQLRRLRLVAPQLRHPALDGAGGGRVLVLDDRRRHAVDHEHHVGAVALARRRLEPPLIGDVQGVGARRLEVDQPYRPVPPLGVVVRLPLPAQPRQHFAVAIDRRRQRFDPLHHRARRVAAHPGVEPPQRPA